MTESHELIAVTRQLGSMTEAGVDILRALKVLHAQTDNVQLLRFYDRLGHELRLGSSLADAMSRAPEVFSVFAVSLVRQGEARGDLAGSFFRIADYLQKEAELGAANVPAESALVPQSQPVISDQCPQWLRRSALRGLTGLCSFFAVVLLIELAMALELVPERWHWTLLVVAVLVFLCGAAWRLRKMPQQQLPETAESTFSAEEESTFDRSKEADFE